MSSQNGLVLAGLEEVLCHQAVGKEHELLNQLLGLHVPRFFNGDRVLCVFIQGKNKASVFELHGSILKSVFAPYLGNLVHYPDVLSTIQESLGLWSEILIELGFISQLVVYDVFSKLIVPLSTGVDHCSLDHWLEVLYQFAICEVKSEENGVSKPVNVLM